jgi:4-hydroxy-tetrahydrodipicolinate synthase
VSSRRIEVKNELKGVIVPLITPVDDQDRVDEPAFRKAIRFVIDAGVHGMFCGGSAGEGPLLTQHEWARMVETAFDENTGRVNLLGGAIDTSSARVVEKVKILAGIGYKNIVVTPAFYLTTKSADEHLRLYGAAREACGDLEMIAYNIPGCTNSVIAVETMCDMAKRGWIRYCKESSGDVPFFKRLVAAGGEVGLKAFMGDEVAIPDGLLAGACGIVPVCANYEPATFLKAYAAGVRGDAAELDRIMKRVLYVRDRLCLGGVSWVAGVKYASASLGIGSGKPVSPLQPAGAEQRKSIDDIAGTQWQ